MKLSRDQFQTVHAHANDGTHLWRLDPGEELTILLMEGAVLRIGPAPAVQRFLEKQGGADFGEAGHIRLSIRAADMTEKIFDAIGHATAGRTRELLDLLQPGPWSPDDVWSDHPLHSSVEWRDEVEAGDTSRGYIDWVNDRQGLGTDRWRDLTEEAQKAYPKEDWALEVANGDTRRGYQDWVLAQIEADERHDLDPDL